MLHHFHPQEYAIQNLLLYHDVITQWPTVYKTSKVRIDGTGEPSSTFQALEQ
jgi:hypothetical protein